MLLLATHSENGWLPGGHALRMGLDIGLHMALDKLVAGSVPGRPPMTPKEERDLGTFTRFPYSSNPIPIFAVCSLASLFVSRIFSNMALPFLVRSPFVFRHRSTDHDERRIFDPTRSIPAVRRFSVHLPFRTG
jgi:hypothetical protein